MSDENAPPELLHDAAWKKIQQNTFTRWVNQQLKVAGTSINDLEKDLSDGIKLVLLAEVLSGRRLPRYNKRAAMRTQQLDNVNLVLKFFQEEEGIKIVTIDSTHIVDHNLKLIMGLIWTLILHYSISQPIQSYDPHTGAKQSQDTSPKQRLLQWIKSRLPSDVPVTNFTSDWNDGVALGALVDACVPGACDEWRSWEPSDALQNTLKAMKAAEDHLGVGGLITPEELINPNVDEKSVMTYLSQFPRAKTQPKGRISGVEKKPIVGIRTHFFVDTEKGSLTPEVTVSEADGQLIPAAVEKVDAFPNRYQATFVPERPGKHEISVSALDEDTNSRFKIGSAAVDAVPAPELVGLPKSMELGERQKFRVVNVDDDRQLDVLVVDPKGVEIPIDTSERVGVSAVCSYHPDSTGMHSVNVFLDKRHIPGSPFPLRVTPSAASNAVVWGRGLCPVGTRIGDELPVHVDSCDRPVTVTVTKDGHRLPIRQVSSGEQKAHGTGSPARKTFTYTPISAGPHHVSVRCGDADVKVSPKTDSAIRAAGPGLEGGVASQNSVFYVDTHGDTNQLEFSIEGPSKTDINCTDNKDGTANVDYTPLSAGRYVVNVLNNGSHIKDSPFVLMVDPASEATEHDAPVKLSGLTDSNKCRMGEPFTFSITKDRHGSGNPEVTIYDPDLNKIHHASHTVGPLHKYSFVPEKTGKHVVFVANDKVAVKGSPFPVHVDKALDVSKLRVYGPGVGSNVIVGQTTSFSVDARQVGSEDVEISLTDPADRPVDFQATGDPSAGVRTFSYTPKKEGAHKLKAYVEGQAAFNINVDVNHQVQSVRGSTKSPDANSHAKPAGEQVGTERLLIPGQISETVANYEASFYLTLARADAKALTARLRAPNGAVEELPVERAGASDHYEIKFLPKEQGLHTIEVLSAGHPIEGSPFQVQVGLLGSGQAHLAHAEGVGLLSGYVGQVQSFNVYTGQVGGGELSVSMDGPARATVAIQDQADGNCRVEYSTTEPGLYTIDVTFDDAHITGSPFKVFIAPNPHGDHRQHAGGRKGSSSRPEATLTDSQSSVKAVSSENQAASAYGGAESRSDTTLRQVHNVTEPNNNAANGDHVAWSSRSPQKVLDGDPKKVSASGEGLETFSPGVPSTFTIDSGRAGPNLLFVGVVTSRGPSDEVLVKHEGSGVFRVSYKIDERSKAYVFVKYGDQQIPGSPFVVRPTSP